MNNESDVELNANNGGRMETMKSESLDQLATALAKVQGQLKSIRKDGSGYGYKYTTISEIMDYVLPILSSNDLVISQFGEGSNSLSTMLIHGKSGQYLKSIVQLPDPSTIEMKGVNIAQKMGAVRTYFKRYSLTEIIGLTSNDEDFDASPEGPKKTVASPVKPKSESKSAAKEVDKGNSFRRHKKNEDL